MFRVLFQFVFVSCSFAQWSRIYPSSEGFTHIRAESGAKILFTDERQNQSVQYLTATQTWQSINTFPDSSYSEDFAIFDSLQWLATNHGFYYSTTNSDTWTYYGDSVRPAPGYAFPNAIAILPPKTPGGPYRLFDGTLGIGQFVSEDGGNHWNEIDSAHLHNFDVLDFSWGRKTDGTIQFFQINVRGIFESPDSGMSWVLRDSAASGTINARLLFHRQTWFVFGTVSGISRRDSATGIWLPLSTPLPPAFFYDVTSTDNTIFVAYRTKGIWMSSDMGEHWEVADTMCPNGNDLTGISSDGTNLYIIADTAGVYSRPISQFITGVADRSSHPFVFELEQNYPNPFNPTTKIVYDVSTRSRVSLKVYNVLGQIVATLKDGSEEAGRKSLEWSAANFASGVYFYKLEATSITDPSKTFSEIRKMALVK